jgi:carboxyl-terminal processing protease
VIVNHILPSSKAYYKNNQNKPKTMHKFIKKFKNSSILFIAGSCIVLLSYGFMHIQTDRDFLLTRNMDIFFSMIREISLFYVDETEPDKLIESGIMGVLEGLDPYTSYIPESEMDNYATMTTGRYGGIGALIRQVGEYVVIIEPYENFPAQKAGLRAGDIITAIDGKSTRNFPVTEVSELLKGVPRSKIEITIQRSDESVPVTKVITREEVKINNVTWYGKVAEGIGYIQFNGFTHNAHQEVKDALNDMKINHGVKSLILDVRGNPGGLLMEAVNVTNLFVNKGQEIVSTRGKVKQWDHSYQARNNPIDPDIPIVVLVGRSSASAAEIVAGAIQDLDRGLVVGQRTFGKGLIQTTRPLSYNAQLKITTAKYYTPSGRSIQAHDFSREGGIAIPDSLINEFKTLNGRKVYGGGGIKPDIELSEERPAPIVISLFTRNHIFNYATKYKQMNQSIPPVADFRINDDEYQKFVEYLDREGFDYETQTEERFRQLVNTAKQEKYFDPLSEVFADLERKLAHDKDRDLETFKKEIKSLLREEIISRYYFQKGRVEATLLDDIHLEKAIDILRNNELYNSILAGKTVYGIDGKEAYMSMLSFQFRRILPV